MLTVEEIHVFACINDEGATIRSFETEGEAAAFAEGFNSAAAQVAKFEAEKPGTENPQDSEAPEAAALESVCEPLVCALDDVTEDAEPLEPSF